MLSPRTTLLLGTAAVLALGSAGLAQADPNLTYVERALSGAPVLVYSSGTYAAWSADGGSGYSGGCSALSGNPFQSSAGGSCTGTSSGASAGAGADLKGGTLSASASTPATTSNGAAAGALMWTTLVFSGAAPGSNATGILKLPFTGSFSNGGIGVAGLAVNPSSNWITSWTTVDASNPSPTLSVSFSIQNGVPTEFAAGLGVDSVWDGNPVTSSLDPAWSLILPAGITYSPVAGDLSIPGGTASVPEPGSLPLMSLGLVLAAWAAARSRAARMPR
jgi:hypothetical protein